MDHPPTTAQEVAAEQQRTPTAGDASERLVRPVAEGRRFGVFTLTQRHFFRFSDGKFHRLHPGSFV
jgi:hypothetical protein